MNFKTFIFMILTFRRVDPIPRNIGLNPVKKFIN